MKKNVATFPKKGQNTSVMKASTKFTAVFAIVAILGAIFAPNAEAARRTTPPNTASNVAKLILSNL